MEGTARCTGALCCPVYVCAMWEVGWVQVWEVVVTRVDQMWSGGCGAWVVGWIVAILAPGFSRLPKFPKKGHFVFRNSSKIFSQTATRAPLGQFGYDKFRG